MGDAAHDGHEVGAEDGGGQPGNYDDDARREIVRRNNSLRVRERPHHRWSTAMEDLILPAKAPQQYQPGYSRVHLQPLVNLQPLVPVSFPVSPPTAVLKDDHMQMSVAKALRATLRRLRPK